MVDDVVEVEGGDVTKNGFTVEDPWLAGWGSRLGEEGFTLVRESNNLTNSVLVVIGDQSLRIPSARSLDSRGSVEMSIGRGLILIGSRVFSGACEFWFAAPSKAFALSPPALLPIPLSPASGFASREE